MRYFQMQFEDYARSAIETWEREDLLRIPRTSFSVSANGADTSVWITDPDKEAVYRSLLQEMGIQYTESDHQQVRTWLDDTFGNP